MYLSKRISVSSFLDNVVNLTGRYGYYIQNDYPCLVKDVDDYIVPAYEVAAYPTWGRNVFYGYNKGKKLALKAIAKREEEHKQRLLLCEWPLKEPDELIHFETRLEEIPADKGFRKGMVFVKEVGMIIILG